MLNRDVCFARVMEMGKILTMPAALLLVASLTLNLGLTLLLPGEMMNIAAAQPSVKEIGAPSPKPNEYYIFTQELNADESKLGVPVAVFTLTNIIVHKGDNVTIHFFNTADEANLVSWLIK